MFTIRKKMHFYKNDYGTLYDMWSYLWQCNIKLKRCFSRSVMTLCWQSLAQIMSYLAELEERWRPAKMEVFSGEVVRWQLSNHFINYPTTSYTQLLIFNPSNNRVGWSSTIILAILLCYGLYKETYKVFPIWVGGRNVWMCVCVAPSLVIQVCKWWPVESTEQNPYKT